MNDSWDDWEGSPAPLGAVWIEDKNAFNFALYSRDASAVTLLLYSPNDLQRPCLELALNYLVNKSGRVWHCRVKSEQLADARYYAYRVAGANDPGSGHRFDDQKILFDPYAQAIYFPPEFSRAAACMPGSNAGRAPLGVLLKNMRLRLDVPSRHKHASDAVIYELHVRHFTKSETSNVPADKRGTFAGLIEKIPYLQDLGITVVELMPVLQQDPQEGSWWGYMPLNFFNPNYLLSSCQEPDKTRAEFEELVQAFHEADIEVVIDMVVNHTAEEDERGPTYSYRGIDNDTYYLLTSSRNGYRNDAGAGNVLNCANRYVRKLIVDALAFWADTMRVDGFRFDLASLFTRNEDGSINLDDPPVVAEITGIPALSRLRLIAEAWDLASYQLGRSFPETSWLQWNGQFRDTIRSFLKGDRGTVGLMMARLYGSSDLFPDDLMNAYHAYQSVNYVTSHDGFSLYDLVSYNNKRNEANGQNNQDGSAYNLSWNCGYEGDGQVPESVRRLRKQQIKNFFCLLMLSNGTPMFCAGDEFMNTRHGNNNPYNQDNETVWLDWSLLGKNADVFRFFKKMISFRKDHPSISRSRFWRDDVRWYGVTGLPDTSDDSHAFAYCLHGRSVNDDDLYVMVNAWWDDLKFEIQDVTGIPWQMVIDTAQDSPRDILDLGDWTQLSAANVNVRARSTIVLMRKSI